jgi:hypothetical protein
MEGKVDLIILVDDFEVVQMMKKCLCAMFGL